MKNLFKQPRMSILEVDDVQMETVLEEIKNSNSVITFYQTLKNEYKNSCKVIFS